MTCPSELGWTPGDVDWLYRHNAIRPEVYREWGFFLKPGADARTWTWKLRARLVWSDYARAKYADAQMRGYLTRWIRKYHFRIVDEYDCAVAGGYREAGKLDWAGACAASRQWGTKQGDLF